MKIRVTRIDSASADAVLPHQYRCMQIVQEISCKVRRLLDRLMRHRRMALARDQNTEPRGRREGLQQTAMLDLPSMGAVTPSGEWRL